MSRAARLVRGYRATAILVLNTLLLLLVVNLGAWAILAALPAASPMGYGIDKLHKAYPGWSEADIRQLLKENWSRKYVYEPFVQHRQEAFTGRFVNVSPAGFRHGAGQREWPPPEDERVVFFLGGSTTYGYGIEDSGTIPSRAQELLERRCGAPVAVYNFGGGNFYSEQERALLSQLLADGVVPDLAVFIDGLNEWKDAPKFTGRLEYSMAETEPQLWLRALKSLPLVDLARAVRDWRAGPPELSPQTHPDPTREAARLLERWLRHRRAVAALGDAFDFLPVFVWQPVPTYGYDLEHHLFLEENQSRFRGHDLIRAGYTLMDRRRREEPELQAEAGFLWLADMQIGRRENFYVDVAHYNQAFSAEIAERIVDFVAPRIGCSTAAL